MSAPSAVSGTRLHAKSLTGGGAREVVGFHDMQRNEDCTFQPAEGGRTRCLPATATANQTGTFSDPGCQVPSLSAPAPTCSDDVKYGITLGYNNNCSAGEPTELRKFLDPATPRYIQGPTGCSVAPAIPVTPTRPATVPLGDVIPWTDFVEAIETIVPGSPVSEKVLVATDGARQHVGYRDDKLGADCSFQLMSDGITRCVPAAREGQIYYGDASCTRPLAVNDYSNGSTCSVTASEAVIANLWLEPSVDVCGGIRNVYRLGTYDGSASGASIFQMTNQPPSGAPSNSPGVATCQASGTLGNGFSNYRTVGDVINTSLPSTPRVSTGGTDRLVPALVWPPAADALVPGWHDTMSDVDCTFTLATDGKMRCLPLASKATILFTDDACKSPTVVAVLSEPSCIGLRRYARVVSTTCPPTTKIYALGPDAKDLMSASVAAGPGQCGKVTQAMAAFDATEMAPSQFVEGVPAVE